MPGDNFIALVDKIAIVTGASAGIGEAIALEFARQGCHLTLCGRDEERLEEVKRKCLVEANGRIKIVLVSGDVVEADVQKRIIGTTFKVFGRIDILVNNAGVSLIRNPANTEPEVYRKIVRTNLESVFYLTQVAIPYLITSQGVTAIRNPANTEPEAYHKIMRTNLESVFYLTQVAIPYLIKSQGNVINISSIASNKAIPNYAVYAMSKAALDSYTKSLSLYLAPHKVRVNSVNPGSVESLLYRRGKEAWTDEQYEQFKAKQSSSDLHPLGGMVKASEVADAVIFLVSDRASFVTGQILFVDGGRNNVGAQPRL